MKERKKTFCNYPKGRESKHDLLLGHNVKYEPTKLFCHIRLHRLYNF